MNTMSPTIASAETWLRNWLGQRSPGLAIGPDDSVFVAGVTVTTRIPGYRNGVGCTAVTNAQGVASCLSTQYATVLGQPPFTATAAESALHLGGVGHGKVPFA